MTANRISKGYNSFSGVDIKAVFANQVIGELQAISYSITREKAPLYTMGSADPRSFSRGKRGIAGTLIFLMFDRHPLISKFGQDAENVSSQLLFLADKDDIRPGAKTGNRETGTLAAQLTGSALSQPVQLAEQQLSSIDSDQEVAAPWFVDQLPPFDVTLAAANEYGSLAVMRALGIEILNEGYGVSIDDIVSELQSTYVARSIVPWRAVPNESIQAALAAGGATSPTS